MGVLNHRIKQLRTNSGLTLAELARRLDVKEATAQRYESGEIKNIKHDTVRKLAEIFDCSPSYLLGWEDSVVHSAGSAAVLPVVGSVKAGWNSSAVTELIGDEPAYGLSRPEEYVWMLIKGNSMEPLICDGDYVLVHIQGFAQNGDLVVTVIDDDEGTIKKYRADEHGVILTPLNNSYEARFIPASEAHRLLIYGIAVEIKRKLR